jgi:hypothetical protein
MRATRTSYKSTRGAVIVNVYILGTSLCGRSYRPMRRKGLRGAGERNERERERGRASEREKDLHGGVSMAKRRWREISSEEDRANNPASCRGSEPENCQSKVPRNKRTFRGAASQTSFLCMCSRGFSPTALVYNYISVTDFIRAQTRRRLRSKPRTCARAICPYSRDCSRSTGERQQRRKRWETLPSLSDPQFHDGFLRAIATRFFRSPGRLNVYGRMKRKHVNVRGLVLCTIISINYARPVQIR